MSEKICLKNTDFLKSLKIHDFECVYYFAGNFPNAEGIDSRSIHCDLHENLNFSVMPSEVNLCQGPKVDIFHDFLFFHARTFSFFLHT